MSFWILLAAYGLMTWSYWSAHRRAEKYRNMWLDLMYGPNDGHR